MEQTFSTFFPWMMRKANAELKKKINKNMKISHLYVFFGEMSI